MQMQRVVSTEHVLSAELRRSEKLIWSGRPRQGVFLTQRDAGMIPNGSARREGERKA